MTSILINNNTTLSTNTNNNSSSLSSLSSSLNNNNNNKEEKDLEEYYYESYREILNDVIIIFDKIEENYEIENNNKKYYSYSYRLFTPYLQWNISKRYNDFLKFHLNLEVFNCQEKDFIKLLLFDFPQKQFFSTTEVIEKRKIAFQKYLEKCIQIPSITMLVVEFLNMTPDLIKQLENHLKELENLPSTSNINSNSSSSSSTSTSSSTTTSISSIIDISHNELKTSQLPTTIPVKPIRLSSELSLRKESNILNEKLTNTLFSFLPEVSRTQKFKLLYSTWRDGWNLSTLYENIGTIHPIIFVIQSADIESEIFGAYISTAVGPPSYHFKGDGHCSIFRLTGVSPVSYSPPSDSFISLSSHIKSTILNSIIPENNNNNNVNNDVNSSTTINSENQLTSTNTNLINNNDNNDNNNNNNNNNNQNSCPESDLQLNNNVILSPPLIPSDYLLFSNNLDESESTVSPRTSSISGSTSLNVIDPIDDKISAAIIAYNSTRTEYIFANNDYIAIGGSAKYGSNAIRLSNDLLTCSCGPSDTYGNEISLVPSSLQTSSLLTSLVKVGEIEVFGVIGIFS